MGYRRIHGEPAVPGSKAAASTVWEILKEHGIPPAPDRQSTTRADLLRSRADALPARALFEVRTPAGARLYVFAVLEHASRRIRVPGATAHPTAQWIVQPGRHLLMDLEDAGGTAGFPIRDRDAKCTTAFDATGGRRRPEGDHHRHPDAPDELPHGALDTDLPQGAAGPRLALAPEPPPARTA
jgi:putative transposase